MSRAKIWANFEVSAEISWFDLFLDQHKNLNDHLAPLVGNPCSNHYTIASVKHENNRNVKQITTTSTKVNCIKSEKLKFKRNKQLEDMNDEYS